MADVQKYNGKSEIVSQGSLTIQRGNLSVNSVGSNLYFAEIIRQYNSPNILKNECNVPIDQKT